MKNKYVPFALFIYSCFFFTSLQAQVLAAGGRHSTVICADSTVRSWGFNAYGQLGNGNTTEQHTSVEVLGLSGIIQVSGGLFHSLFVKEDGTVWASGRNLQGPLGDGTTTDRSIPVQVSGLSNIVQSAGGGEHSLFLANDGTVWACGLNTSGQLGDGTNITKLTPVKIPGLADVIQVAAGAEFSIFLKNDGTVWMCGHNGFGQFGDGTNNAKNTPYMIEGLEDITQVSAGEWHSLFVKMDGTVLAAGRNQYGQLGDGSTLNKNTPVQVAGLSDIIQSEAGGIHSVFVKSDGTVWACGLNSGGNNDGQLGDGTSVDQIIAVQVFPTWGSAKITYALATREHSLFLDENGLIWGSGRNNYGQLGHGAFTPLNFLTPVQSVGNCAVLSAIFQPGFSDKVNLSLFPNPTVSVTTFKTDIELFDATLVFINNLGQRVKSIHPIYDKEVSINHGELASGIYHVLLLQNNLPLSHATLMVK